MFSGNALRNATNATKTLQNKAQEARARLQQGGGARTAAKRAKNLGFSQAFCGFGVVSASRPGAKTTPKTLEYLAKTSVFSALRQSAFLLRKGGLPQKPEEKAQFLAKHLR